MKGKKTMNKKLTLGRKKESEINELMNFFDHSFKLRRKHKKNITYKQNLRENFKIMFSEEFQSDLKKIKKKKGVN